MAVPLLPTWWLLFQQLFWLPQFLGFVLVPNILLPMQVTALAGHSGEGAALGMVNMLIQISGFTMPLIGAWSDRTESLLGIRGARRPFILYGQLGVLFSIYIMMRATTLTELALGNFLFSALNNLPTTVYAAVLPELVPPAQRGRAGSFQMFMQFGGSLLGYVLGVLVGDGRLSQDRAYWLLLVVNAIDIPLGMIGVGEHPGLWSAERLRFGPEERRNAVDAAAAAARWSWSVVGASRALLAGMKDFFAPFWKAEARTFRCFFVFSAIQTSAAQFGTQYAMYWLRDEIGGCVTAGGSGDGGDDGDGYNCNGFTFFGSGELTTSGTNVVTFHSLRHTLVHYDFTCTARARSHVSLP